MYISGDIKRKTDNYFYHYTLYSLSVFSLAKSLWLIWEISADNWLICSLRAQCMISKRNQSNCVPCDGVFVVIVFQTMYKWHNYLIRFPQNPHPIIFFRISHLGNEGVDLIQLHVKSAREFLPPHAKKTKSRGLVDKVNVPSPPPLPTNISFSFSWDIHIVMHIINTVLQARPSFPRIL